GRDHLPRRGEHRDALRVLVARQAADELQVVRDGAARRVHRVPDRVRDGRHGSDLLLLAVRATDGGHRAVRREAHADRSGAATAGCRYEGRMNELISPNAFKWFLTIITGGVAGAWFVYDTINLIRTR